MYKGEREFSIFTYGEYDNSSKRMINKILNHKNRDKNRFFVKTKLRASRKDNSDNIRKKIKSKFHKILNSMINEKLRLANSIKFLIVYHNLLLLI